MVEITHRKAKGLCRVFPFQLHPAAWNGKRKFLMGGYAGRAELRQFRTADKTSADRQIGGGLNYAGAKNHTRE